MKRARARPGAGEGQRHGGLSRGLRTADPSRPRRRPQGPVRRSGCPAPAHDRRQRRFDQRGSAAPPSRRAPRRRRPGRCATAARADRGQPGQAHPLAHRQPARSTRGDDAPQVAGPVGGVDVAQRLAQFVEGSARRARSASRTADLPRKLVQLHRSTRTTFMNLQPRRAGTACPQPLACPPARTMRRPVQQGIDPRLELARISA